MLITSPSIGQRLARAGEKAMFSGNLSSGLEQTRVGGSYLVSIHDKADIAIETSVASTAIDTYNDVKDWKSKFAVAEIALSVIGAGVGGAVGLALAETGKRAMFHSQISSVGDQARIAVNFAEAIVKTSDDPVQVTLAESALKSAYSAATARSQASILADFFTSTLSLDSQAAPAKQLVAT